MSAFPLPLPMEGARVRIEPTGHPEAARLVRISDGIEVGQCRVRRDEDAIIIDALVVDPLRRGYGLGSEAAALLRAAAGRSDVALLRAVAPPDLGLAVYFWSRMGFHPLHGPGPGGGIWMERRLNAAIAARGPRS